MPNLNTRGRIDRFNIAQDYTAIVYKVGTQIFCENYLGDQIRAPTTDAYTAINAAVTYLQNVTSGGKLFIDRGTYTLTTMINIVGNDIGIYGVPGMTIIQTTGEISAFKSGTGVYNGGATATRYNNNSFEDFDIDMNGSGAGTDIYGIWLHTTDDFRISNVHIYGQVFSETRTASIAYDYCIGGVVEKCHIHDTVNGIVPRKGSRGSTVQANHVHDILRYDGITPFQTDGGHLIQGNYVHECNDNGILLDGGPDGRNPGTIVDGNYTWGNGHEGIESFASFQITISDNHSYDNDRDGIRISSHGDEPFTLSDNQSYDNAENGIRVFESRYGTINGNSSYGNGGIGMYLESACNYNTVSGNNIWDNDFEGLLIEGTGFCSFDGNVIRDNSQAMADTYDEIFLTDTSNHNAFTGGTIRSNAATLSKFLIEEDTDTDDFNSYVGIVLDGGTRTPKVHLEGVESRAHLNPGYNPVGLIGNPWPATGTNLLNEMTGGNATPALDVVYQVKQTEKTIIVKGGTVTDININSSSTGLTSGVFTLSINSTIEIKGSGAPTTGVIRGS